MSETDIGVPAFRSPDDVTLPKLVEMPFFEQPSGEKPRRGRHHGINTRLIADEPVRESIDQ